MKLTMKSDPFEQRCCEPRLAELTSRNHGQGQPKSSPLHANPVVVENIVAKVFHLFNGRRSEKSPHALYINGADWYLFYNKSLTKIIIISKIKYK